MRYDPLEPPPAVAAALNAVRWSFPEVTHVVFMRDASWVYLSDAGEAADLDGEIDPTILEDAADEVTTHFELPCAFAVREEE